VGESQPTPEIAANQLNTYPAQVPVAAGDVIGFFLPDDGGCAISNPVFGFDSAFADAAVGSTIPYAHTNGVQLDVSALLEPDADGDGFGDDTQDACPEDAGVQGECVPPTTKIKKRPKPESKKSTARFKFKSNDPEASFECKLKGKGLDPLVKHYNACQSPRKYTNLEPGKYKFFVRALDAAGNPDPTPAKAKFEVVENA
jgi:hypothetical protein